MRSRITKKVSNHTQQFKNPYLFSLKEKVSKFSNSVIFIKSNKIISNFNMPKGTVVSTSVVLINHNAITYTVNRYLIIYQFMVFLLFLFKKNMHSLTFTAIRVSSEMEKNPLLWQHYS